MFYWLCVASLSWKKLLLFIKQNEKLNNSSKEDWRHTWNCSLTKSLKFVFECFYWEGFKVYGPLKQWWMNHFLLVQVTAFAATELSSPCANSSASRTCTARWKDPSTCSTSPGRSSTGWPIRWGLFPSRSTRVNGSVKCDGDGFGSQGGEVRQLSSLFISGENTFHYKANMASILSFHQPSFSFYLWEP